jgi:uncharacterized RDD family membrane protein YckC
MSEAPNPFAPPQAEVADVPVAGPALAGRGTRLLAVIIDGAVLLGLFWLLSLVSPINLFAGDSSVAAMAVNTVLGFVLFLLVQGVLLVRHGQTVGKRMLGLRIVRRDGSRVGAGRMLGLRYGLGWLINLVPFVGGIYSLVDALLIFRASRLCLHDQIADTHVVIA